MSTQTVKDRWEKYRAYGASHGIRPDDLDDFAQDAYVRYLEAGTDIVLRFVLADFMRAKYGKYGSHKQRQKRVYLDDPIMVDASVLKHEVIGTGAGIGIRETLEICAAKASRVPVSQNAWMTAVALYFDMTLREIERLLRKLSLHGQTKQQADRNRASRDFASRARRDFAKKLRRSRQRKTKRLASAQVLTKDI